MTTLASIVAYVAFALICVIGIALILPTSWNLSLYFAGLIVSGRKAKRQRANEGAAEAVVEPVTAKRQVLRFAVIICACNEEKLIGHCVESILKQDYPQVNCYVVADNCTDKTAQVAAQAGAVVLERVSALPSTKGQALVWGMQRIREIYQPDIWCIFDADTIAPPDFLSRIEHAFVQAEEQGQPCDAISGVRIPATATMSLTASLETIYWGMTIMQSSPHAQLGLNALATGTGFAFREGTLDAQWRSISMTEDTELGLYMTLGGKRIGTCPAARCYDEPPSRFGSLARQMWRWQTGGIQLVRRYLPLYLRSFLRKPSLTLWDGSLLLLQLLTPMNIFLVLALSALFGLLG